MIKANCSRESLQILYMAYRCWCSHRYLCAMGDPCWFTMNNSLHAYIYIYMTKDGSCSSKFNSLYSRVDFWDSSCSSKCSLLCLGRDPGKVPSRCWEHKKRHDLNDPLGLCHVMSLYISLCLCVMCTLAVFWAFRCVDSRWLIEMHKKCDSPCKIRSPNAEGKCSRSPVDIEKSLWEWLRTNSLQ